MSAFSTFDNLDEKDSQALKNFRDSMQACLQSADCPKLSTESLNHLREKLTDSDCLRFIRARKYDVGKAVIMATKWSEWYYTNFQSHLLHPNGDRICPANSVDHPYSMENVRNAICPHSYCGMDKQGRPVYWEETGLISTRFAELSTYFSVDDLTVQHVRMQEMMRVRCEYSSKLHGRCVDKVVCVMNLKGLSYSIDREALRAFRINLQIDTDYYPERLKYLYMINAPWFFTSLWAMMRPLIDPVTADKIKIVGKDYLPVLREHIDDDQIPPELGGSCTDFKWAYPFPESTGVSEAQLGYLDSEKAQDDAALQALGEIRSRTNSREEVTAKPKLVCLAAVVNARITEVERLKSHDEYIITIEGVETDDDSTTPQPSRRAKHRYSDFHALRTKLKRLLKSERESKQVGREPSPNQHLRLPQLPPKKLFSQTGSVLSSRILGLSSFLTTLLLSVKISDHSVYYPGSALYCSSKGEGGTTRPPSVMEDPVAMVIMQFLDAGGSDGKGGGASKHDINSMPSQHVAEDLHWSKEHTESAGHELEGREQQKQQHQQQEEDDEEEVEELSPKESGSGGESAAGGLQSQLKRLAGGGIVSVAIFGLSVASMYLQQ